MRTCVGLLKRLSTCSDPRVKNLNENPTSEMFLGNNGSTTGRRVPTVSMDPDSSASRSSSALRFPAAARAICAACSHVLAIGLVLAIAPVTSSVSAFATLSALALQSMLGSPCCAKILLQLVTCARHGTLLNTVRRQVASRLLRVLRMRCCSSDVRSSHCRSDSSDGPPWADIAARSNDS